MTRHSSAVAYGDQIEALRARVNERLSELVPEESAPPERLHRAIRYSLLAPGKRIRPIVALLSAEAFGSLPREIALDPACAIEMVHAASLIVDDFPFMDDADERRGRASSHRAFGLQTATLASLALLNRAFALLADADAIDDPVRTQLVRLLARALGDTGGAIAGQEEDLESPDQGLSLPVLETMVRHKTAALFVASAEIGALAAGAPSEMTAAAREFGWSFGLCFQALDDLVDRPAADGSVGDSQDAGKATFVSVLGVRKARQAAEEYAEAAVGALDAVGLRDSPLGHLTEFMLQRAELREAIANPVIRAGT